MTGPVLFEDQYGNQRWQPMVDGRGLWSTGPDRADFLEWMTEEEANSDRWIWYPRLYKSRKACIRVIEDKAKRLNRKSEKSVFKPA